MRSPKPPPTLTDAEWLAHLDALARSGLSVPEYARQHGLKADTLYKRRFAPGADRDRDRRAL